MITLSRLKILIYAVFFGYTLYLAAFSSSDLPSSRMHGSFFPYLADKPIHEDGFYMLTVARSIAEGNGFQYTYNSPTTGVQPLATLLYAGVYFLTSLFQIDAINSLRFILVLASVLFLIYARIMCRAAYTLFPETNKDFLEVLVLLLTLMNFDLFYSFFNGLETGVYTIFIVLAIMSTRKLVIIREPVPCIETQKVGIVFGLASLARLDFLLLSGVFWIAVLVYNLKRLRELFIISYVQVIFLLPWIWYIYVVTGTIFQTSISAQTGFVSFESLFNRSSEMIFAVLEQLTPFIYTASKKWVLLIVVPVMVGAILYFTRNSRYSGRLLKPDKLILRYWAFAGFAFIIVYIFYSFATYFYFRYTTPLQPLVVLLFLTIILGIINTLLSKIRLITPILVLGFLLHAYFYFHSGKLGVEMSLRPHYIAENFSSNEKIGIFQSGVAGYFCPNVINLDGKVNHRVLDYSKSGQLNRYLDSSGVNVLIEWREAFENGYSEYFENNWVVKSTDLGDGRTVCLVRKNKK